MARPSYGPEAKKRSRQLLAALLDYANHELDCDETALEGLRSQIQVHWQTEQRLVVRTKVRFLEALTKLAQSPLSGEHIKEALRRFEDFIGILDDNRPNKGGSEVWHFTLNLWHNRRDRDGNLHRFEQEWEHRRPQKSKQVTQHLDTCMPLSSSSPWWQWCKESLETQQYQRLTINPLTVSDGLSFDLHELYLPLGLVERKRQTRQDMSRSGKGFQLEESEELENTLSLQEFLSRLQSGERQQVAIVGEAGAGKTTVLQKIAAGLLEQHALPIWIALADLQGATLDQYLLQDWLKQVTRNISVPLELQEALAEQFRQGQVWLLLDAIDEMAIDPATALTRLAHQLRGWIGDAHVVLTCRSNVWDCGKNALDGFRTYCNLSFSHPGSASGDQVRQFIDRWFQDNPALGTRLQQELSKPKHKRIRDAVKNPLRLALLCRSWSLAQGMPHTKALLYQQFVDTLYAWKQDRFPTTLAQRQQLNQALGQVALAALTHPEIRFRLPHSFAQKAFGASLECMSLALQLGWLNQVGVSTTTGETVYAFYHPTFQEYFAAQAISDWQFFVDPSHDFPLFSPHWREVILLWLGRPDVATADKDAFIQALMGFEDGCNGFYTYQSYFLAVVGLAEYPQCTQAEAILAQLLAWQFNSGSFPASEAARAALLQTDRTLAIAALEHFIQSTPNPFACWNAAYSLGKVFDPGNAVAIATLAQLITTLHREALRLQAAESLGRIDSSHPTVISTLEALLQSSQDHIRRRAAYSLGKWIPGHPQAIATLEGLMQSTPHATLRVQAAESLIALEPHHEAALAVLAVPPKTQKTRQNHPKLTRSQDISQLIVTLEQKLAIAQNPANQRRLAYRLGTLQPGHAQAIACLMQLLLSQAAVSLGKRVVEDLKDVLLEPQLTEVVAQVSHWLTTEAHSKQELHLLECHKLLWYCAQRLPYPSFADAYASSQTLNPRAVQPIGIKSP